MVFDVVDTTSVSSGSQRLCEIVSQAPVIVEHDIGLDLLDAPLEPHWAFIGPSEFKALFQREMLGNDTAWAMGKFTIAGSRTGLLVRTGTTECDHPVRFVTLHLFDGCSLLPHRFFLVHKDDHGGVYESSARFTSKGDTLVLSVKEGELGEIGVDTVLTRTDWIRLAPGIDTVLTQTGFEVRP